MRTESCGPYCASGSDSRTACFCRRSGPADLPAAILGGAGLSKRSASRYEVLDEKIETMSGHVSIGTMHLAKGLEFRAVAVMVCDDEVTPLQERIETAADDTDMEEALQHRAPPPLRRLHPRPGPPPGDGRGAGIGVPRRSADVSSQKNERYQIGGCMAKLFAAICGQVHP